MIRKSAVFLFLSLMLLPAAGGGYDLSQSVSEFKLANGMRWLVVKRAQAPVFSGIVMVRAGGVDEEPGKTGLAHMFEHMAFKGSDRIGTRDWKREKVLLQKMEEIGARLTSLEKSAQPDEDKIKELRAEMAALDKEAADYQNKNEIWEMLMRNGARGINAYTSKDVTAYFASMPSDRLDLWAAVTAEMIFRPVYRDFYTERSVVTEERRTGVDNSPSGSLVERLLSLAYASGPHRWSVIGFEEDIKSLTIEDARRFHSRHYSPSNMVGVIVGDVSAAEVRRAVANAFGPHSGGKKTEAPQVEFEKLGGVRDSFPFDAQPAVAVAFHKPILPDHADYVFDVIASLLCDGETSRLEKRLIYERRLAKDVYCSAGFPGSRLENLFLIWVEPLKGSSPKAILRIIEEETSRLGKEPLSADELERIRKMTTAGVMFALDRNERLAEELARFEIVFNDWRILGRYPDEIAGVTPEEVMETAKRYLVESNMVVVERTRKR